MIMLLFIVFLNFVTMCYYVGGSYLANLMDPDKNAFGFTEVFWNSAPFVFVLLTALLPSINIHSYSDLVNLFAESVFDPSMSGDIEEVPNESLPLSPSIEEPSMPVVAEEEFFLSRSDILILVLLVSVEVVSIYGYCYWC